MPFRKLGDIRLNINLFRIFLAPLLHQAAGSFLQSDAAAKNRYETFYRGALKKFLPIPRTTSTQALSLIHEEAGTLLKNQFVRTVRKTAIRQRWIEGLERLPLVT